MKIAIILAGGEGQRIRPITATLNKSLIPIDGVPALRILLELLEGKGFTKVIILTGYLHWQINRFLEDENNQTQVSFEIIITPENFSPFERIINAKSHWDASDEIYLCYCDNIIDPIDLFEYLNIKSKRKILVQKRSNGNIEIDRNNRAKYFANRSVEHPFVELGFIKMPTLEFANALDLNRDLPEVLQNYTNNFVFEAFQINTYKSISSLDRYLTIRKKRLTILLDRDGIINENIGRGKYVSSSNQIKLINRNLRFLAELTSKYNVDYIVISNQAGIERKLVTNLEVLNVNRFITSELVGYGVPILAFYVCPHHWDSNCDCRKPRPGLINQAIEDFKLERKRICFIGDTESDLEAAINAEIMGFKLSTDLNEIEIHNKFQEIENFVRNLPQNVDEFPL